MNICDFERIFSRKNKKAPKGGEKKMMYRRRRYDVFRFAQNDVAPVGRNDAIFASKCGEATHHQA